MSGGSVTLTEFLRARLDDDEERARFVQREQGNRARYGAEPEPWRLSWHDEYDLLCIEPSRALAEVAVKRLFLADHEGVHQCDWGEHRGADYLGWCTTLQRLALPYAEHPEYDESWRP